MNKQNGPWTIKNSRRIFKNEFFTVVEDDVIQPDRSEGKYATVRMMPGVCVLALDEEGHVYLTRQFRYAIGQKSLEVIMGGNDGEEPLVAARREAREELGIEAEEWIELGVMQTQTSIVDSPTHLFLARRLSFCEPDREGTEVMEAVKIRLDEAVDMVLAGEIVHAISCALILKASLLLND